MILMLFLVKEKKLLIITNLVCKSIFIPVNVSQTSGCLQPTKDENNATCYHMMAAESQL